MTRMVRLARGWVSAAWLGFAAFTVLPVVTHADGVQTFTNDDDGFEYAVILDEHTTVCSVSEPAGWNMIGKLQKKYDHSIVWFRLDGDAYVIHDAQVVKRAQEIIQPMHELGKRQGALGRVQGDLGSKQGTLGMRQAELGMKQGSISRRLDRLEERIDDRRERHESTADLERERARIRREIQDLEAEERAISGEQEQLGARQEELGRRQEVLGKEQERVSERAKVDLRRLAEQTVANHRAEEVR